jgi:hypothetical protein
MTVSTTIAGPSRRVLQPGVAHDSDSSAGKSLENLLIANALYRTVLNHEVD